MPLIIPDGLVVSVSGLRGRVGDPLTPELVCGLAAAFGAFLRRSAGLGEARSGDILIGRDTRPSGPMLSRAAITGLVSVGSDVVDLGVVATPTLMLAVENSDASGGIAVTASHNPAEWNALKFAAPEGTFLDAERMSAFLEFALHEDPPRAAWDELGTVRADDDAAARHLEAILELPQLDLPAVRSRAFKVALDCVRGAGATIMPQLLEALGCELVAINMEMDGRFPRDPEPTAENLGELADLVRRESADIGFAVDPDVDRLSLVNENGTPLGEDLTLALASAVVLRRTPGIVVTNLSTSSIVEDVARAHGSELVRSPVGEINVARRMQSEGAVVGGRGKRRSDPSGPPPHERCPGRSGTRLAASGGRGIDPFGCRGSVANVHDREEEDQLSKGSTFRRVCGVGATAGERQCRLGRWCSIELGGATGVAARPAFGYGAGRAFDRGGAGAERGGRADRAGDLRPGRDYVVCSCKNHMR